MTRPSVPGCSWSNLTLAAGLVAAPALLGACSAQPDQIGTAQEAITVCPGASTLQGVDVYEGDGTIDWTQVKSSGRAFAFVKASEGLTITDSAFSKNWAGMKQAGVVRGAYHFFHANDDPMQQVTYFLSVMGTLEAGDLPPTLDLEVTDGESAATITANAITWLDAVAAATGTKPILYCSPSFVTGTLGSPAGLENHAQLWIANWQATCPDVPAPFTTFTFWQTNDVGTVPGVPSSPNTDVDEFNGDLAALMAITSGGSTSSSSSSSSGGPPTCTANGVAGTCIDTSVCASMPGYMSTPDLCPGPASEQCCTPTNGTSSSSSSSGSSSSTTSSGGGTGGGATGTSSSSGGAGASGAGGSGTSTGGHTTSGGPGGVNTSSGCSTSPASGGAGSAGGLLAILALPVLARRRRRDARA